MTTRIRLGEDPGSPRTSVVNGVTYEHVGTRGVPWNTRHPLLFHVLTTLPIGDDGTGGFLDLVARNAALEPKQRRGSWAEAREGDPSHFGHLDLAAGDGAWLFLSVGRPYRGGLSADTVPAVAFDLGDLLDSRIRIGWRGEDLIGDYDVIGRAAGSGALAARRMKAWAKCQTLRDRGLVDALVRLETGRLRAAGDKARQDDIRARAEAILDPLEVACDGRPYPMCDFHIGRRDDRWSGS
jgi:hypothetical protein